MLHIFPHCLKTAKSREAIISLVNETLLFGFSNYGISAFCISTQYEIGLNLESRKTYKPAKMHLIGTLLYI